MKKRVIFMITAIVFIVAIVLCLLFIGRHKNIKTDISKNPVQIVFITDNRYVLYMRAAIRSIIANKKPDTKVEINVIGLNLYDSNVNKILKETKKNAKINLIKITDKDIQNIQSTTLNNPKVSRADNVKFFLPTILKNSDRVIYLDGDTVILKDLFDFYNTDLGDNYVGAVDDWQSSWENEPTKRYFNNGVMLLNLKKMREDNVETKLIDFKKNDKIRRFVTQDAFNTVMYGKVKYMPLIYDTFPQEYDNKNLLKIINEVLKNNFDPEIYPYKTANQYRRDVVIIHYCGYTNVKPWYKLDFARKSSRLWYKYAPADFWIGCIHGTCRKEKQYSLY